MVVTSRPQSFFPRAFFWCWVLAGTVLSAQIQQIRNVYRTGPNDQLSREEGPSIALSLFAGGWIPTGNLALLGNHPSLGFNLLFGYRHLYCGALFDFRLPTVSPENSAGSVTSSAVLAALDFRWEFLHPEWISVFLVGGGGYESLTPFSKNGLGTQASQAITVSFNGGLAVRKYLSTSRNLFADLQVRYAIPAFKGTGPTGADLAGNYVTVLAGIGVRFSLIDVY